VWEKKKEKGKSILGGDSANGFDGFEESLLSSHEIDIETTSIAFDWTKTIDGHTQTVHDTTDHTVAGGNHEGFAGSFTHVTLGHFTIGTQNGNGRNRLFEVQGKAEQLLIVTTLEFNDFSEEDILQTTHTGDTINDGQDNTGLLEFGLQFRFQIRAQIDIGK